MTDHDFTKAIELALDRAGHRFPRLSTIRAKADPSHNLTIDAPDVDQYAMFLADVTVADGEVRLIETNGSNGALSSTVAEGDIVRARHMAAAFSARPMPAGQVVVVLCHQAGFLHQAEFFTRAELFRVLLAETRTARLRGPGESLGDEQVAIVCGSTAEMAALLERRGSTLQYQQRPVVFASNANLLPELRRRGVISELVGGFDIDETIFHEGSATLLVLDKCAQQEVAALGKGIVPLVQRLVHDRDQWVAAVEWFQQRGLQCVAKMHGGSGGTGIELVLADMNANQCLAVLDRLLASARRVYGEHAEATAWPIQLFEFAKADPVAVNGAPHLWDLRVMALARPGEIECHACVARLCPEPFDGTWRRGTWVSNLTGRDGNTVIEFMRAPGELFLPETSLALLLQAVADWTVAAARWHPGMLKPTHQKSSNL